MDRLLYLIGDVQHTKLGGADSFSDRLSCKYTVYMLSMFVFLVSTFVYVGEPIGCFCPANFAGSHVDYANKVCWSTNTHYQPFDKDLPKDRTQRQYISYYQWIPLFLASQAVMFYVPRLLWRSLSRKSGIVVYNITDAAIECQRKPDKDEAEKTMQFLSNYMIRHLREVRNRRDQRHPLRIFRRIHYAFYLTIVYVLIKLLYAANAIGQLLIVNVFIGTDYHLYGFDVIKRMVTGVDWTTSARFPRVTICDFKMRVLHNIHDHTVQCALPMNLYNEMMFIFLWFWFVFVSAVAIASLVYWIAVVVGVQQQVNYVRPRLAAMGKFDPVDAGNGDAIGVSTLEHGRPRSHVANGENGIELIARRPVLSVRHPSNDEVFSAEFGHQLAPDSARDSKRGGIMDVSRFVESYLMRDGCLIVRLVAENSNELIAADLLGRLYDHYTHQTASQHHHKQQQQQHQQHFGRPPPSTDETRDYGSGATSFDKQDSRMLMTPTVGLTSPHRRLSTSSSRWSNDAQDANVVNREK